MPQLKEWSRVYNTTDVNVAWENMKSIVFACIDVLVPRIIKRIRGEPCPWLTPNLIKQMNIRDQLLRRFRKTKDRSDHDDYKCSCNNVNKLVFKAKQNYYKDLLNKNTKNPDKFWNCIKRYFQLRYTVNLHQ